MLYTFPKLYNHQAYRLNRNLIYFFAKLKRINAISEFNPCSQYFDVEFANFLNDGRQQTLKSHFENFFNTFKNLPDIDRTSVISTFFSSQKIAGILENTLLDGNAIKLSALPINVQQNVNTLFSYLYSNTINSFGRLKDHYKILFDGAPSSICPFCGIEILNAPALLRQDYDHMLLQSEYIFTTVNMENIIPTGVECNRTYKHGVDVLYWQNQRTIFNSGYARSFPISLSLEGSTPPKNLTDNGNWVLTISPNNEYTQHWDRIYKITRRYKENVLQKFYNTWLKEFRDYLFIRGSLPISSVDLGNEFTAYGLALQSNPTSSQSNIVKGAFYSFVASYDDQPYQAGLLAYINSK